MNRKENILVSLVRAYHIFSQSYSTINKIDFFWENSFHEEIASKWQFWVIWRHCHFFNGFSPPSTQKTSTLDVSNYPFREKQKSSLSILRPTGRCHTAKAMEYSPCQHESLLSEYDWLSSTTDCNCSDLFSKGLHLLECKTLLSTTKVSAQSSEELYSAASLILTLKRETTQKEE